MLLLAPVSSLRLVSKRDPQSLSPSDPQTLRGPIKVAQWTEEPGGAQLLRAQQDADGAAGGGHLAALRGGRFRAAPEEAGQRGVGKEWSGRPGFVPSFLFIKIK